MLRALLLQSLYSIPGERVLCERVRQDPHAAWFVEPSAGGPLQTAEAFGQSRGRLFAAGIAPSFVQLFLKRRGVVGLLLDWRVQTDAGLLESWARQRALGVTGHASGELVPLLLLPRLPDALRYLPYLDAHDGTTPLEIVIRRLCDGLQRSVVVPCWSEAMATRLAPIVGRGGGRLLLIEPVSRLTQLASAAAQLHAAHVAICEPGTALLPARLVRQICDDHIRRCHDVTRIPWLPHGARAEVYSTWCLHRLRASAPKTVDFTPGDWLDWARGIESQREILEDLRNTPWPDAAPAGLPARVDVETVADWQKLASGSRQASGAQESDAWSPLTTWHGSDGSLLPDVRRAVRGRRQRPRVLFVLPSTAFSGPERMYAALTNGLLDRHVDIWGLVVRHGMTSALLRPAYRERLIADGVEFGRPTLASFDYCLRILRAVRPDLVHCNGVLTWPILAAAGACKTPVLQHVRVSELDGLEDRLRAADRLIAVSTFVVRELLSAGVAPARVRLSYDAIDAARFQGSGAMRRAARRRLSIPPDAFVLLCVARCTPSKRIEVVIRAFAQAMQKRRNALLLVVGEIEDPLYYESLNDLIVEHGIKSRVRFLQAVEDMRALHATADALVLASVREALGIAVLEAMAMQTPVIASASGGIPEVLDDSCGTLVEPDSIDAFVTALRRVARGDEELLRKARRARSVVQRRFNLDDHVEAIRRIYLEL